METVNIWKWYDGSGTFPSALNWDQGGLWREDPDPFLSSSNDAGVAEYACIIPNDILNFETGEHNYGISNCWDYVNPKGDQETYECYPIWYVYYLLYDSFFLWWIINKI